MGVPEHILHMGCFTRQRILGLIQLAKKVKANPLDYSRYLEGRSLALIFNKPSLRTRISFQVGMTQLGGNAIYYPLDIHSTLGKKENVDDFARVLSRYVDAIAVRVPSSEDVRELASHSSAPVINALDDNGHPCQILGDLLTISEIEPEWVHPKHRPLKVCYLGDAKNNVTYDILRGMGARMGMEVAVGCPKDEDYCVPEEILEECRELSPDCNVWQTFDPSEAAMGADIVYTDSWFSYGTPEEKKEERERVLCPYRVTQDIMARAHKNALFMHCLPAQRGYEVTADVIDGNHSVVFQQVENRLYAQNALLLQLLRQDRFAPEEVEDSF